MRGIETLMREGQSDTMRAWNEQLGKLSVLRAENDSLRQRLIKECDEHEAALRSKSYSKCDLTWAQLLAVYAAARWAVDDNVEDLNSHMRELAGPRWRYPLRRGIAAISRTLARHKHPKRKR